MIFSDILPFIVLFVIILVGDSILNWRWRKSWQRMLDERTLPKKTLDIINNELEEYNKREEK